MVSIWTKRRHFNYYEIHWEIKVIKKRAAKPLDFLILLLSNSFAVFNPKVLRLNKENLKLPGVICYPSVSLYIESTTVAMW